MTEIKFGILGCGNIAHRHARHIIDHPNGVLVGAVDVDSTAATDFCRLFQTEKYESIADLLESEVDIVSVCTPSGLHAIQVMQVLRAKKNVLVEKPMALLSEDAIAMEQCALDNRQELFVVKQNRYNPPVQRVHELIQSSALGNIYQVSVNCFWNRNEQYYSTSSWKGRKDLDGGVLFNQFSHFVDILYFLFGSIKSVQGQVKNLAHQGITEFEDSGVFSFILEGGALGSLSFTTAACNKNMEGSITIFSENATIKIGGKYLNTIEYFESSKLQLEELPHSAPSNNYGYYEGSMSNHDKVVNNVIQTLLGKERILTSAKDGVEVVKMIEQFYSSAD